MSVNLVQIPRSQNPTKSEREYFLMLPLLPVQQMISKLLSN